MQQPRSALDNQFFAAVWSACRVVELRFFGGLSIEDTAIALGVSQGTVMRDWTLARAWLQRPIISSNADAS